MRFGIKEVFIRVRKICVEQTQSLYLALLESPTSQRNLSIETIKAVFLYRISTVLCAHLPRYRSPLTQNGPAFLPSRCIQSA
jgi:hypothetical protein